MKNGRQFVKFSGQHVNLFDQRIISENQSND